VTHLWSGRHPLPSATPATAAETAVVAPSVRTPPEAETGPTSETPTAPREEHAALPDIAACALPVFAPGTFDDAGPPDQGRICNELAPRHGAAALRADVVRANRGRATSEGVREWSLLGWYEMAVFSVIRARCCPSTTPLALPALPDWCVPLDAALNELGATA